MARPDGPPVFSLGRDAAAEHERHPAAAGPRSFPIPRFPGGVLIAIALAFAVSQGCTAAVGLSLLGTAVTSATKTGISYTVDSRANKTFAAPVDPVRQNILAALEEMAFLLDSHEKEGNTERILAKAEGREVEVELEEITPRATKVRVVVHEGLFLKDRATAEEIIEQAGRGVEAAVVAARASGGRNRSAVRETPAGGGLREASASWEPWDPQRWREGFKATPIPAGIAAPLVGPAPVVPPVSHSLISLQRLSLEDRLRRCPQYYTPFPSPLRRAGREAVACGREDSGGAPQVP